nr:immunoglobulin light chain junction region [Macaca mulatta]
CMSWHNNSYIF